LSLNNNLLRKAILSMPYSSYAEEEIKNRPKYVQQIRWLGQLFLVLRWHLKNHDDEEAKTFKRNLKLKLLYETEPQDMRLVYKHFQTPPWWCGEWLGEFTESKTHKKGNRHGQGGPEGDVARAGDHQQLPEGQKGDSRKQSGRTVGEQGDSTTSTVRDMAHLHVHAYKGLHAKLLQWFKEDGLAELMRARDKADIHEGVDIEDGATQPAASKGEAAAENAQSTAHPQAPASGPWWMQPWWPSKTATEENTAKVQPASAPAKPMRKAVPATPDSGATALLKPKRKRKDKPAGVESSATASAGAQPTTTSANPESGATATTNPKRPRTVRPAATVQTSTTSSEGQ
jgi:hypothetical protein